MFLWWKFSARYTVECKLMVSWIHETLLPSHAHPLTALCVHHNMQFSLFIWRYAIIIHLEAYFLDGIFPEEEWRGRAAMLPVVLCQNTAIQCVVWTGMTVGMTRISITLRHSRHKHSRECLSNSHPCHFSGSSSLATHLHHPLKLQKCKVVTISLHLHIFDELKIERVELSHKKDYENYTSLWLNKFPFYWLFYFAYKLRDLSGCRDYQWLCNRLSLWLSSPPLYPGCKKKKSFMFKL